MVLKPPTQIIKPMAKHPPPLLDINLIRKPTGQSDPYSKLMTPIPPTLGNGNLIPLNPFSSRLKKTFLSPEDDQRRVTGEREGGGKERKRG